MAPDDGAARTSSRSCSNSAANVTSVRLYDTVTGAGGSFEQAPSVHANAATAPKRTALRGTLGVANGHSTRSLATIRQRRRLCLLNSTRSQEMRRAMIGRCDGPMMR